MANLTPYKSVTSSFNTPTLPTKEGIVKGFIGTPTKEVVATVNPKQQTVGGEFSIPTQEEKPIVKEAPTKLAGVGTTQEDVARFQLPTTIQNIKETNAIVGSNLESKVANEQFGELFGNDKIEFDMAGMPKLSKQKAIKDIQDFANPKSDKAKAFIANLGEDKYKFAKYIKGIEDQAEIEKSKYTPTILGYINNTSEAYGKSMFEGIVTQTLDKATDKILGTKLAEIHTQQNYAHEINISEGMTEESPIASTIGGLLGDIPKYGAMSYIAGPLAIEAGIASKSPSIVKFATNLDRISKVSPTLYAATVDNAVVTAMDYGMKKAVGNKDISITGFIQDLVVGAAFPVGIKSIGEGFKLLKGVLPKDIANLEKAVVTDMQNNGSTNVDEAISNLTESFKFEDGATLSEKVGEYKSSVVKNQDSTISHQEVIATLSKDNVVVTNRGGKKLANAITTLNEKLKPNEEVTGAYGTMGENDKIQLAKQEIIAKTKETPIVNGDEAQKIIDEALLNNGIKKEGDFGIVNDPVDELDEVLHNPNSKPELIPEAKTMEELNTAITGEKKVSLIDIENSRDDVEMMNRGGAKSVKTMADATGVKFDWDKAVDKNGVANKSYLYKSLDAIESKVSGYEGFATRIKKQLNEKVKSLRSNIKAGTKIDLIGLGKVATTHLDTIKKDINILTKRLATAKTQVLKDGIQKTINSKNLEIDRIKSSHSEYKQEVKLVRQLTRSEIDEGASNYKMVNPSTRVTIKNKYKARISSSTTLDVAQEIVEAFHKEMFTSARKSLERKADNLLAKVMSHQKKTKKANLPYSTTEKLIETHKEFAKASSEGDLLKMEAILNDLNNFYQTGRDAFKANKVITNIRTKTIVSEAIKFLETQGKERFEARFSNTENAGAKAGPGGQVLSESFGSNLVIKRMFRGFKPLEDIFYRNHDIVSSDFVSIKKRIKDEVASSIHDEATKKLGYGKDDASTKLTLWFRSKSDKGHPGNMRSNFIMERTKNGDYKARFERNPQAFRKANMEGFANGDFVHFGTSNDDGLKNTILNKIYSELDSLYNSSPSFKANVDEFYVFANKNGDGMAEKTKRLFNKIDFFKDNKYFPFFKSGMGEIESAFDSQGNFSNITKSSLKDGMLERRVDIDPNVMIDSEMGFMENVSAFLDTNVWWEMNIENFLEADRMIRWMKKGRNGALEDVPQRTLDEAVSIATLADDMGEFSKGKSDALDNPIISPEAVSFLRRYTAMVATRGRSEMGGNGMPRWLNGIVGYDNMAILSSPFTTESQVLSYPLIPFHSGLKNTLSAEKSAMFNTKNINYAYDQSGKLMERQRNKISKEGTGNERFITSDETIGNKINRNVAKPFTFVMDRTTKFIDGAVSTHAWFAAVSKYLDDNNLAGHKAGNKFDLETVHKRILNMDNGEAIWKDVIQAGNDGMTRTMGSNQIVDKSLNANDSFFKVATIFQKTGINTMVSILDRILEAGEFAKVRGENPRLARSIMSAKAILATMAVGALALQRDNDRRRFKEMIGVSEPLDMEAPENSVVRRYISAYLNGNFVGPKDTFDLWTGFRPIITDAYRATKSETVGVATEETVSAIAKAFVNSYYVDGLRFATSKIGVGMTKVDADKYNAVVKSLKEEYSKAGKDFMKEENAEEIIQKRLSIAESKASISKATKPFNDAEAKLIKDSLSKYNGKPSFEQFMKEYNANKSSLKPVDKVADVKSLYKKVLLAGAKTSGQRDSVLSGMNVDLLFEVELKDLIDSGKAGTAKKRWQEMVDNKVFKTPKGAMDVYKKMVIYNKSK